MGAQILRDLGIRTLELLTNNPAKYHALRGYGLEISARVPLQVKPGEHNQAYLNAKRDKMGHDLGPSEPDSAS